MTQQIHTHYFKINFWIIYWRKEIPKTKVLHTVYRTNKMNHLLLNEIDLQLSFIIFTGNHSLRDCFKFEHVSFLLLDKCTVIVYFDFQDNFWQLLLVKSLAIQITDWKQMKRSQLLNGGAKINCACANKSFVPSSLSFSSIW